MSAPRSEIDVDHELRLADEHDRRDRDFARADRQGDQGFYDPELSEAMRELASKREAA